MVTTITAEGGTLLRMCVLDVPSLGKFVQQVFDREEKDARPRDAPNPARRWLRPPHGLSALKNFERIILGPKWTRDTAKEQIFFGQNYKKVLGDCTKKFCP